MKDNKSLWDRLPPDIQKYIIQIKNTNKENEFKDECYKLNTKYKDKNFRYEFYTFYLCEIKGIKYCLKKKIQ